MSISTVECCDCMDFMAKFPDKYFDLAIVDPPYGLGNRVVNSSGRFARYKNKNGNWDMEAPNKKYFDELFRVSQNQIIWGGNYFELPASRCFLIWDKKQPEGVSFASCEYAWSNFDSVAKTFYYSPMQEKDRFHVTQKPTALYIWLLQNYAKPGDKILDTHMGSQSSRIAAWKMGFDFWGCEIDPEYFEQGCKRFEKEASQQALFTPETTTEEQNKLFEEGLG